MADTMHISIYSPERRLLEGATVESVLLTGSEGQIEILPGHAPMTGTLETGVFSYRIPGDARLHKGAVRLEDNLPGLRVILSLPL